MTRPLLRISFFTTAFVLSTLFAFGQKPNYTANDKIAPYTGYFAYGCNPGYYGGYNNNATNDKLIADLFNKINLHTIRPALYDDFLEQWGINIRISEFDYYTKTLGMHDLTLFLSQASTAHRETATINCNGSTKQSLMFKNMYQPIWDDSTNGKTPINDQNYFAAYVYKVVKNYGKYIKFYEIWNEPDFVYNGNIPLLVKGQAGNWWENNPDPCDLVNMNAPITSYVRLMRIAYEVIKSVDPNAMVTTGGLGYENFLDAILRNTDAPDGKVTNEYPLKGGAYFDVISYHSYPQYALSAWDNSCSCRKYYRHSDNAANQVITLRNKFKTVLEKYGYDGKTFPSKHTILTETNIPEISNTGQDHIGSPEAQRNFAIKMFVLTQKNDIKQSYIYTIGNSSDVNVASQNDGFDAMGLYYNLNKATPSTANPTDEGFAVKSLSGFLHGYAYNATATTALNLPSTIEGAAFTKGTETRYVLWAKTITDQNEVASVSYVFPTSMNVQSIQYRKWDFAKTATTFDMNGNKIDLDGSPFLITTTIFTGMEEENMNTSAFAIYPNPTKNEFSIRMNTTANNETELSIVDMKGLEVKRQFLAKGIETIFISGLKAGVYQIQLTTNEGVRSEKLVVGE